MLIGVGDTLTETAGVTVIVAGMDFVVSATDVAVRVTAEGLGWLNGAVYLMAAPDALAFAESAPQAAPEHPAPESDQVTPLFCESFWTVALKLWVPIPACTDTAAEDKRTVMGGGGGEDLLQPLIPRTRPRAKISLQ